MKISSKKICIFVYSMVGGGAVAEYILLKVLHKNSFQAQILVQFK
jgi:hypothetical protein